MSVRQTFLGKRKECLFRLISCSKGIYGRPQNVPIKADEVLSNPKIS
ncbi:MAG: hypothetical protein ACI4TE_04185 [Alphaproteobacteria bacterium]